MYVLHEMIVVVVRLQSPLMQFLPKKITFGDNPKCLDPLSVHVRLSFGLKRSELQTFFPRRHLISASIRQALHCHCFEPDFADHRSILVVAPRKTMAFEEKVTTHMQR